MKERRELFDGVARRYDRVRPGYPEELLGPVWTAAGLGPDEPILEIGCGTGQLTRWLADRGNPLVGLEPGAQLAQVARENLAAFPRVRVQESTFEDWELEAGGYGLVASAQAFHWVPSEVGLPKVKEALRPGGSAALIWNWHPGLVNPFVRALQPIYERLVPEQTTPELLRPVDERIREYRRKLEGTGLFERVDVTTHPWAQPLDEEGYLSLLQTYSDHILLEPERWELLRDEIAALIRKLGGIVERPYLAVCFHART